LTQAMVNESRSFIIGVHLPPPTISTDPSRLSSTSHRRSPFGAPRSAKVPETPHQRLCLRLPFRWLSVSMCAQAIAHRRLDMHLDRRRRTTTGTCRRVSNE
jgi:hypothetical protein